MDGVEEFFQNGKIVELQKLLLQFIDNNNVTTKIDGAPAIVMWSDFPGLNGPGVSFKTIIKQVKNGTPKNVFNTIDDINAFMSDRQYDNNLILSRGKAFEYALQYIAPYIKPGCMLWGDVLFTNNTKKNVANKVVCTPNTLTYEFNTNDFPDAKNAILGICIHSAIDTNFNIKSILDANKFLKGKTNKTFILQLNDIKPELQKTSILKQKIKQTFSKYKNVKKLITPNIGKILRKATKSNSNIFDALLSDKKDKTLTNEQKQYIANAYIDIINLKEEILKNCKTNKITTKLNNTVHSGEGYVVGDRISQLKLVSTEDFTKHNIAHMKRTLHENIEGKDLVIWTSSKDSNLFKYYIDKTLTFSNSGGSNYGFAVYGILEPRFSLDAKTGYKEDTIAKIYGENIFQFKIPCDKVLFFQYDIYKKTPNGKNSKQDTFIKEQLVRLGFDFTDAEIAALTPKNPDDNTSTEAMRFYKLCSRKYNLLRNGTIDTPAAGFVYKGKMDGITYVGWKPYDLEPSGYSNDNGKTWKYLKKSDKLYKDYIKGKSVVVDNENTFDGNKTPEKEKAYRLLMAFNSNDTTDDIAASSYGMSEGIFYDIVIHDDKTIDAKFKNNRPISDGYIHYYRPAPSILLDKLFAMGFRFNNIHGAGIKFGSETNNNIWKYYDVPKEYMPKAVDLGVKLVAHEITSDINIPCKHTKDLYLTKCEIAYDAFSNFNVVLDDNPKKLNWTISPDVKQELMNKYKWADTDLLLTEKPIKQSKRKIKTPRIKENDMSNSLNTNILKKVDETECIHLDITDELLHNCKISAYNVGLQAKDHKGKDIPVTPKKFPEKAVNIVFPVQQLLVEVFLDTKTKKWDSCIKYNGINLKLSPEQMEQFFNTQFYNMLKLKLQKEWPLSDELYGNLYTGIINKEMLVGNIPQVTEDSNDNKNEPTHNASGRKYMNFGDMGVKGSTAKFMCWPKPGKEFNWSQWKDWKKIRPLCRMRFKYTNSHEYGLTLSTVGKGYENRGFKSYDLTAQPILQWLTKEENEDLLKLSIVNKFIKHCVERISKYVFMEPDEIYTKINNPDKITVDEIVETQSKIRKTLNNIIKKKQPDNFKFT